jgi:hypothetical protein
MRQADVLVETTASTFYRPSIFLVASDSRPWQSECRQVISPLLDVSRSSVGVCPGLLLLIRGRVLVVLMIEIF